LLDTSARTNSAKQPSVHFVFQALGPSCAMIVHERAASSESDKDGVFEKEESDCNSVVEDDEEHRHDPRRACHAMT
jgi:hypothetical protein